MDTAIVTKEFQLSKNEYRRALRHIMLQRGAKGLVFTWLIAGYLALGDSGEISGSYFKIMLAGGSPLLLLALGWTLWILVLMPWQISISRNARPVYRRHRYLFTDETIAVESADGSRMVTPYSAVIAAEQWGDLLLIQLDSGLHFILPRLAFPDREALEQALTRLPQSGEEAVTAASDAPDYRLWSGLKRNLAAGLRLAGFRRVGPQDFSGSADQVLLLVLVTAGFTVGAGYLTVEKPAEFYSYALTELATSYLIILLGAYLVTRLRGRLPALALLLVVLLSPEPLFTVVSSLLENGMGLESPWLLWLVFGGLFLWVVAVWWRAIGLVLATDRLRTSGALLLFCAVTLPPQLLLLPNTQYWYSTEPTSRENIPDPVNVEETYYAQPRLVAQALEPLLKERPGTVDLYHIGFGSYAHQEVFRREVNHVRDLLDRRFDTRDRSLLLINNPQTVEQTPIASASNLELALQGVAERMNPKEDILFLYLTSHGSQGAELSVTFHPLRLNTLSADGLRRILDEAGIRWRVVVISACYSGSFVDALKDDGTLVITAANKDNTSFGCSNENEYTYFGEAYFKHALARTHSFADAFEFARRQVTERERREGLEPSQPMIYLGKGLEGHLTMLEQRLELQQ